MKNLSDRIEISAKHLGLIDEILDNVSPEYHHMRDKLFAMTEYENLADQLYSGQNQRQMILGDLLLYILTGRGYWTAIQSDEGFKDFLQVLMYIVNLLLIQESVLSAKTEQRRAFLKQLKDANLKYFFATEVEEQEFTKLAAHIGRITVREPRDLYKVMDSLLPRTPGVVHELLVYVYLLNRKIGYIVPLLMVQRIFRGIENIAPPDFLLLRQGGEVFGVEVGSGMGQFSLTQGKIEQVNLFTQDTSVPVLTTTTPHVYRCETCEEWITFCDEIIERTVNGETDQEFISCPTCPRFDNGNCPDIIYYGQIKVRGDRRRHHYHHYYENDYVQNKSLSRERDKKLIHYFPSVKGLERLTRFPD